MPNSSQEGMTTSMPGTHVVKQVMHLRSRERCYCDMKIVGKVGNYFEDVILDFDQIFMNGQLQVTAENFNELLD